MQLETDSAFRHAVAAEIANDWLDELPPPDAGTSVPEPVKGETEPVDRLVRMPELPEPKPQPVADEPAPVGFQVAASADVPEVQNEPAPVEPEMPPVAPEMERAARDLASQIWNSIPVPRATIGLAKDQILTHCVALNWWL
jgi:hypothetical protein